MSFLASQVRELLKAELKIYLHKSLVMRILQQCIFLPAIAWATDEEGPSLRLACRSQV